MKFLVISFTLVIILSSQGFSQWWFQQNSSTTSNLEFGQFTGMNGYAVGTESQGTYLLFKTTTGGTIWFEQDTLLPSSTGFVTTIYFQNSDTGWFIAYKFDETSNIYKTTDGGETWQLKFEGPQYGAVLTDIQFTDQSTGYAAGSGQLGIGYVYKSTDGGNTWVLLQNPVNSMMTTSLCFINNDLGWIAGSNILKTTDGGENWELQLNIEPHFFTSVHFVDELTGWASSQNSGIYKTTDGGGNWFQQSVFGLTNTFFISTTEGWLISGHDIYYTSDGGDNWLLQNSNTWNELNDIFFINRMEGWAAGDNGTILFTPYGGNPWDLNFEDDFDQYTGWLPLSCQNPGDWMTWNSIPCDAVEDPYISTAYSYSYPNSVKIIHWNNLIKSLDNIAVNRNYINFRIYIPTGKTGYFNILSEFDLPSYETGMECYFDAGGTGRLMMVPDAPVTFNYTHDEWHYVQVYVDFSSGQAGFWFDGSEIYTWQWSQNGTVASKLAANNFYGYLANSEFYIDDYLLHSNCLSCLPPPEPENLTLEEIFNDTPVVKLNWEYNSLSAGIQILRKNGLPGDPENFEQIGLAAWNDHQYSDSNVVIDSTYTYGVMAYNIYGNSDTSNFASITVIPVPVDLISFTGRAADDDVVLEWNTATETNNKGFEVERKTEGGPNIKNSEWKKIGFVEGHGTSSELHSYSYIDKEPSSGKYSYRIKQIDFNGSYEYSNIISVETLQLNQFVLYQNYPNPFNQATTIKYYLPEDGKVRLKIYNDLGQEVLELLNAVQAAGSHIIRFDAGMLASGIYLYKLNSGSYNVCKKMIILK